MFAVYFIVYLLLKSYEINYKTNRFHQFLSRIFKNKMFQVSTNYILLSLNHIEVLFQRMTLKHAPFTPSAPHTNFCFNTRI